jgi:hypothetical protein
MEECKAKTLLDLYLNPEVIKKVWKRVTRIRHFILCVRLPHRLSERHGESLALSTLNSEPFTKM